MYISFNMAWCRVGPVLRRTHAWLRGPSAAIWMAYLLSSLVYRVWDIALGLSLVVLDDSTLRLVAIYGLASSGSLLIAGGWIGCWVDNMQRMKALKVPLLIHTLCTVLSAVTVGGLLLYADTWGADSVNSTVFTLIEAVIIIIAILAKLSINAFKIAVFKDWLVVVTDGDSKKLANLNALLCATDLVFKTVSPIAVVYLMTSISRMWDYVIISGCSVVFGLTEYGLLVRVYHLTPELAVKVGLKGMTTGHQVKWTSLTSVRNARNAIPQLKWGTDIVTRHCTLNNNRHDTLQKLPPVNSKDCQTNHMPPRPLMLPGCWSKPIHLPSLLQSCRLSFLNKHQTFTIIFQNQGIFSKEFYCNSHLQKSEDVNDTSSVNREKSRRTKRRSCLTLILTPLTSFAHGWSVYAHQTVFLSGLGVSTLQMSVLNFDSLTVGYIYAQDVGEPSFSLCFGAAAFLGLVGIFSYTKLQARIGLHYTGLCAFILQVLFLSIALMSVLVPGSPFNKDYVVLNNTTNCSHRQKVLELNQNNSISSMWKSNNVSYYMQSSGPEYYSDGHPQERNQNLQSGSEIPDLILKYEGFSQELYVNLLGGSEQNIFCGHNNGQDNNGSQHHNQPKTSVHMFLAALVLSNMGLWMADLSVIHLYQHQVAAAERGVVGGVQASLNKLLLMVKFGVVVILPHVHTFGYLIMGSFTLVLLGTAMFVAYVGRARCKPQISTDNSQAVAMQE